MNIKKQPFTILMAEDNEHDIVATKRAFKKHNINNPLHIVNDGEECLDYLYKRGKYAQPETAPRPSLLLLDIRMPKMDGLTVLKHIREDDSFRLLPVVILTVSKAEEDKLKSYKLGANAYIKKPVEFDNFAEAIKRVNLFWEVVELPEE